MIDMPDFDELNKQLVQVSDELIQLLTDAEKISNAANQGLSQWKTTCRTLGEQLAKETMRIAVVGAIKSGKSTFVNTLFGGDHLKRGAGVVTSIVTRVRSPGETVAGHLAFENLGRCQPGYQRGGCVSCPPITSVGKRWQGFDHPTR